MKTFFGVSESQVSSAGSIINSRVVEVSSPHSENSENERARRLQRNNYAEFPMFKLIADFSGSPPMNLCANPNRNKPSVRIIIQPRCHMKGVRLPTSKCNNLVDLKHGASESADVHRPIRFIHEPMVLVISPHLVWIVC